VILQRIASELPANRLQDTHPELPSLNQQEQFGVIGTEVCTRPWSSDASTNSLQQSSSAAPVIRHDSNDTNSNEQSADAPPCIPADNTKISSESAPHGRTATDYAYSDIHGEE
jgi:hypothetical protein